MKRAKSFSVFHLKGVKTCYFILSECPNIKYFLIITTLILITPTVTPHRSHITLRSNPNRGLDVGDGDFRGGGEQKSARGKFLDPAHTVPFEG